MYSAGGCSYFKDTMCVLCEPILNCPQENIRCTDKDDQTCTGGTGCNKGFWDVDCKPCTVCALTDGYFEKKACTQKSDTVCAKGTECEGPFTNPLNPQPADYFVRPGQWMRTELQYFEDRKCDKCTECKRGMFTKKKCVRGDNKKNLHGDDTVCQKCTECKADEYVYDDYTPPKNKFLKNPQRRSGTCSAQKDTTCTKCTKCAKGKYIKELCVRGNIFEEGIDTVCKDCTKRGKNEWELFACGGTSDALYRPCSKCLPGEYQKLACTNTTDTLCPDCTSVKHCVKGTTTCTNAKDQKCGKCDENFSGDKCCYQKTLGSCGTVTTRERIAFRYGFDYKKFVKNEAFIDFCRDLCEEFPDCMAFEVDDGGKDLKKSGQNNMLNREATCYFKAAFTKKPGNPAKDCYSNICRQGQPDGLKFSNKRPGY